MAPKKIVFFKEAIFPPEIGKRASLLGVKGHYALGDVPDDNFVNTSFVVDIRNDGNTIETKNTIYKKE